MKRKSYLYFVLILSFFIVIAGCSNSESASSQNSQNDSSGETPPPSGSESNTEETYSFKVGMVSPEEHSYTIGFREYAQAVEEATEGRITFEVFPGGALGGEREMVEQVQLGSLDMALITSGVVANFAESMAVLEMPFIFRDLDHVYTTLDSEIGNELLAELSQSGIKGIAFWENGFRHFFNNERPIYSPDDMSGLVMRTIENDIFVETYRALGADPTPIAWPEVYTSVQQGVVQGFDASIGVAESTKVYEVQDYMSQLSVYYASAVLMINEELFNSLPADLQEVLVSLGKEYAPKQRELNQSMEAEQLQRMVDAGLTVIPPEEIDIEAFREAVQSVYEGSGSRFGDYIERIQNVE